MSLFGARTRRLQGQQRTRIDWGHSATKDLSYFRVLDSFCPTPLHSRVQQNMVVDSSTTGLRIAGTAAGVGMVGSNAADKFVDVNNKFDIKANTTMLAFVTPNFPSSDTVTRCAICVGQADNDASVECMIHHHSDAKWYLGIYNNGTDNRVIISGAFQQYAPLVVGWTCAIGGSTVGWVAGKVIGTSTSPASLPNSAVNKFYIGSLAFSSGGNGAWSRGDGSAVHWVAIWDRILNDAEIRAVSFNPFLFLRTDPPFFSMPGGYLGRADGVASVDGHVFPTYQGRADGAANVAGVGLQRAFADGIANVIGITPALQTTGHADGVANVAGLPAVPAVGHADGIGVAFSNRLAPQAAALIAGI